jgi:hypothetical protein
MSGSGMLVQRNRVSEFQTDKCQKLLSVKFSNGTGMTKKQTCCMPGRPCQLYGQPGNSPSEPDESEDTVRVECSNETCRESGWMHSECFDTWERNLLTYMRSCGRARHWSDKQRVQNIWTKKGYDLVRHACACKCGSGFLRKDLTAVSAIGQEERKQRRQRRRSEPGSHSKSSPLYVSHQLSIHSARDGGYYGDAAAVGRCRTMSMSSGGSSPPLSGSDSSPSSPESDDTVVTLFPKSTTSTAGCFFSGPVQAASGNIFRHRNDFNVFQDLPVCLRNPYHIKLEDEGQFGNDETRSFIMVTLSVRNIRSVDCVVCGDAMPVFDKYPLVDGTFFLSPRRYNTDLKVKFHGQRHLYMNAVCFRCMIGRRRALQCKFCKKQWSGSTLVIGTMYSYDIFAAMPCCAARLTCSACQRPFADPKLQFFSDYSRSLVCPHCKKDAHHFVKAISEFYYIL